MISLIVPTRYRPDQLAAMWDSALATAGRPDDLELVWRTDSDDPTEYPELPGRTINVTGPRLLMSCLWNDAQTHASGDIFWHGGDDNLFRTPGWDTAIREAVNRYPDGIVFVHGADGGQGSHLGTHGFLTARWVQVSGWFLPPYFPSDYNDTWLTEVADQVGRRVYLPDVLIEHMHPTWGKGPWDRTHEERLGRHDPGVWDQTVTERHAHAGRLREAMGAA
jgi:hypothetical protein